jgi:hypothetical protein
LSSRSPPPRQRRERNELDSFREQLNEATTASESNVSSHAAPHDWWLLFDTRVVAIRDRVRLKQHTCVFGRNGGTFASAGAHSSRRGARPSRSLQRARSTGSKGVPESGAQADIRTGVMTTMWRMVAARAMRPLSYKASSREICAQRNAIRGATETRYGGRAYRVVPRPQDDHVPVPANHRPRQSPPRALDDPLAPSTTPSTRRST